MSYYSFCYFAYLNLGPKTIKNGSNILPKLASKTMLQDGSILDPTWLHFGKVLAPKLEPSWHQNALKIDPRTYQKKERLLNRLRTDFWCILVNFGIQDGGVMGNTFAPYWGSLWGLGGSWAPRPSKSRSLLLFS